MTTWMEANAFLRRVEGHLMNNCNLLPRENPLYTACNMAFYIVIDARERVIRSEAAAE